MVALLEAQAHEIRALQRGIRALEGRLDVLVELDAMVADQLRTPITLIERSLDELGQYAGDARWHSLVDDALAQVRSVKGVVGELVEPQQLGPAPVERARLVRVPLDGLVEQALSVVSRSLDRSRVTVDLPPGYLVTTAPRRFVGILVNLFENAATYGGSTPIECEAEASEGWLRIQVADRGPGLGGCDVEELFQPLAEEERDSGCNRGAGLYLVRMLARSLGGDATVADRPGGGAVATVRLPQRREGDRHPSGNPPSIPSRHHG